LYCCADAKAGGAGCGAPGCRQNSQVPGVASCATMRVMATMVVGMVDNRGRRLHAGKGEQHQQDQDGP
jgi:hypothetical protein